MFFFIDVAENVTKEQMEWAFKACQRCLIYLGDIGKKHFFLLFCYNLFSHYSQCVLLCYSIWNTNSTAEVEKPLPQLKSEFHLECAFQLWSPLTIIVIEMVEDNFNDFNLLLFQHDINWIFLLSLILDTLKDIITLQSC